MNILENQTCIWFKRIKVSNRFPFHHLGDESQCYRAEGIISLISIDSTFEIPFSLNTENDFFDKSLKELIEKTCKN